MDSSNPQEIQALVQELQLARNQIQTVSTQINEISLTLESLSKQDKNRPVFRAVGNLLLEVDDRDELIKELSVPSKKAKLEVAVKTTQFVCRLLPCEFTTFETLDDHHDHLKLNHSPALRVPRANTRLTVYRPTQVANDIWDKSRTSSWTLRF